jgi:uncharacterized membrane protein
MKEGGGIKIDNFKRPVLKIPKTKPEIALTTISLLLLIANIIYLCVAWSSIPDKVPMHFNAAGEVDRWGGKGGVLVLPFVAAFLWSLLTVLEKYPHTYNYIKLSKDNVEKQYKNARMMMNVTKAIIVIYMVYWNWQTVQVAYGNQIGLGVWELPIFLLLLFGSMAFFIIRSLKLKL